MRRTHRAAALALAAGLLHGGPAVASDAAVGLAPVGALIPIAALGGAITTVMLGIDVSDGAKVHPAFRNISLGLAGFNVLSGTTAIVAASFLDEEDDDLRPVLYGVGGGVLAIGLTGGVLGLVVDTYEPANDSAHGSDATLGVAPAPGGGFCFLSGTF